MDEVRYDMAFMFKYSERPKTLAERKFEDDVPEEVKGAGSRRSSRANGARQRAHPSARGPGASRAH